MDSLGLYLHVPFCLSKCPYCDFYSIAFTEEQADRYTTALCRSIELSPCQGRRVDSVYFGGGTPVLLGPQRLSSILLHLKQHFSLTNDCEITLEANPAAMELTGLQQLRNAGFNRISIGVQSAVDSQLALLGRRHNLVQALESVQLCRHAGFQNISVDLMLGTPEQTAKDIDAFLAAFSPLVDHISAYMLKVEENTPFARQHMELLCPDEDSTADLYLYAVAAMERCGFFQYEISNFAHSGKESRHNLKYWRCEEYLGFGPAAHSFVDGQRHFFARDLASYCAAPNPWNLWQSDGPGGDFFEYAMLRLRLKEGLALKETAQRFPHISLQPLLKQAHTLASHNLVEITSDHISLTTQGFLLSNSIIWRLLSPYDEISCNINKRNT